MMEEKAVNAWWSELRQDGMLLSPTVLDEYLPDGPVTHEDFDHRYRRLRDAYTAFQSWNREGKEGDFSGLYKWLDMVLESFLAQEPRWWFKETKVPDRFKSSSVTGEALRPNRVLCRMGVEKYIRFLLRVDKDTARKDPDKGRARLGMGRGRVEYSKLLETMRGCGVSTGILTNGHQFRLVYAGIDHECWVEWEAERWFEDEDGLVQSKGFLSLCGRRGTEGAEASDFPFLKAVLNSRTRQGELSQVMGEQTRRSVERLLSALNEFCRDHTDLLSSLRKDPATGSDISEKEQLDALYQSSIRVVMRLVVTFFAEARHLLPRTYPSYDLSYGIEGLYKQLRQASAAEGEPVLAERHSAWPRVLALFRLIHEGSAYSELPLHSYGGTLFKRGDLESADPVLRALAIYEDDRVAVSDAVVLEVLRNLKIGKVRTRVGRSSKWVSGPVDFSDLRTEYIGMMYEGLLDYQLRQVTPEQEAIVFLNIGQQPALPFSLLKKMDKASLKNILTKLVKEKVGVAAEESGEEGEEDAEDAPAEPAEDGEAEEEVTADLPVDEGDVREDGLHMNLMEWAKDAVILAGLVKKPRGRGRYSDETQLEEARRAASRLILSYHRDGDMYLVRSSGTRKGSGTFYTKPQLAVPTVHRTLEPLVYDVIGEGSDRTLIPKRPEDILAIKVCDPAMGSGSFLVAALRYLSDGLYDSLRKHSLMKNCGQDSTAVSLPFGRTAEGGPREELIRCKMDDGRFEPMLKARLKRHVVERCIYGVDINSLAVELAKLSLWVETMDPDLPFHFLDHKLKTGNSLVGCWFDRFREYPVMAWLREGGDKDHKGVHFEKGAWTKKIKEVLDSQVKPELVRIIQGQAQLDDYAFRDDCAVRQAHERGVALFEEMHAMPVFGDGFADREAFYRERILGDADFQRLRDAFDLWCAVWFWPGDGLDPDAPTPERFYRPTERTLAGARRLAREVGFFHWELEFPEAFVADKGGFDAVVGNPPWEISKPNSKEFYTVYDPIYRTYGKQEAITHQGEIFTQNEWVEQSWLHYSARFKGMSNWSKNAAFPFGDPKDEARGGTSFNLLGKKVNEKVHKTWRDKRTKATGYADPEHPFRDQGSADINTYKMFLETAHAVIRTGGRFGIIVPSGIYADNGTTALRGLFLDRCKWEWLFGFENKRGIFDIHRSFKFCPIIVEKGGTTDAIRTAFMRHDLADWEATNPATIPYGRAQVDRFSPKSRAILEVRTERDLRILEKIYANSVLLGDQGTDGWGIKYAREFDMTNDSHLFPPRTWWEEKGYKPDQYGRWLPPKGEKPMLEYKGKEIGPRGDVALPLYEGRMIDQFDFSAKGWVSGKGRSAVWREITWDAKVVEPQYCMSTTEFYELGREKAPLRVGFMDITSATNTRTMISSGIGNVPCGNIVPLLMMESIEAKYCMIAVLNSIAFDASLRTRLGGVHLNYFVVEETPIPPLKVTSSLSLLSSRLILAHISFSPQWLSMKKAVPRISSKPWRSLWAITFHERLRLRCMLDAVVAELYGLDYADMAWILRDCAWPAGEIRGRQQGFDPKGFWRIDKDKDPELRHTVLTLRAFADLKKVIQKRGGDRDAGIREFSEQNDWDGWMLPDTMTYEPDEEGLVAFDTPDGRTVPVRERMGERFLPWQLEKSTKESWQECERHARNILGDEGFEKFMVEVDKPKTGEDSSAYDKKEQRTATKALMQERLDSNQKRLGGY